MPKVKFHAAFAALQGKMDEVVFKKINGKFFITKRAVSNKPRSKKQKAWQARFREASDFARCVKANPALLAFYAPLAQARGCRMREVILSDAFKGPQIDAIDLSGYTGQPGSVIRVRASDNFGVLEVLVSLRHVHGAKETGKATLQGEEWQYVATSAMPSEGEVAVRIFAEDRPHNKAMVERTWTNPAADAHPSSPSR